MGIKSKLEQQLRRAVRFGNDEEAEELRQLIADLQKARGDAAYQRAQAKNTYVVKEGDSPFSVAEDVLGDVGWFYELMDANPGVYTFHPGMEIYLPSGAGGPAPVSYADYEDAVEGYEAALREPTETELPDWLKTEYEAEATREEGSQQTAVEEAPVVDDDAALDQLADDVVALMGKLGLLPDNAQGGAKVAESPVEAPKVQGEESAQEYVDTWYSLARQDAKLDGEASVEELAALTTEYERLSSAVESGQLSEEAARELVFGEEPNEEEQETFPGQELSEHVRGVLGFEIELPENGQEIVRFLLDNGVRESQGIDVPLLSLNYGPYSEPSYSVDDLPFDKLSEEDFDQIQAYLGMDGTEAGIEWNESLEYLDILQRYWGLDNAEMVSVMREMYYPTALDAFIVGADEVQVPSIEGDKYDSSGNLIVSESEAALAFVVLQLTKQLEGYKDPGKPELGYRDPLLPIMSEKQEAGLDHLIAGMDGRNHPGVSNVYQKVFEFLGSTNISSPDAVTWEGDLGGVVNQMLILDKEQILPEAIYAIEMPNQDLNGDMTFLMLAQTGLLESNEMRLSEILAYGFDRDGRHAGTRYTEAAEYLGLEFDQSTGEILPESRERFIIDHAENIQNYGLGLFTIESASKGFGSPEISQVARNVILQLNPAGNFAPTDSLEVMGANLELYAEVSKKASEYTVLTLNLFLDHFEQNLGREISDE